MDSVGCTSGHVVTYCFFEEILVHKDTNPILRNARPCILEDYLHLVSIFCHYSSRYQDQMVLLALTCHPNHLDKSSTYCSPYIYQILIPTSDKAFGISHHFKSSSQIL